MFRSQMCATSPRLSVLNGYLDDVYDMGVGELSLVATAILYCENSRMDTHSRFAVETLIFNPGHGGQ